MAGEATQGPRAAFRRATRAFAHRNYRLFFLGQLVSLIGTWMQIIAQSWLVFRLTQSPFLLGLAGFAGQFPVFAIGPFMGAVADRFPRQRILITTSLIATVLATVAGVLTVTGRIEIWQIFVLAALLGTVNALDAPTRQSFLLELVGRADLGNAIALNSSVFNAARLVGPAVGGLVVASIGEGWCFIGNGLSYLAATTALVLMRLAPVDQPPPRQGSRLAEIAGGFAYARATPDVGRALLLLGIVSLAGMPYATLMPIFANEILGGGARGLGILMSASGLGALAGALTLAARQGGSEGLAPWPRRSAAAFGLGLMLFAASGHFWLSALLLSGSGFALMFQAGTTNLMIQLSVPDALRGRVMALYTSTFLGLAPFGALLAGVLANHIGAPWTVALCGCTSLLAGLAIPLHRPANVTNHTDGI